MNPIHARFRYLALLLIVLGVGACSEPSDGASNNPPAPAVSTEPPAAASAESDQALPPDAAPAPPAEAGEAETQASDDPHVVALLHCESLPPAEIAACRAEVDAARERDRAQQEEESSEPPK